VDPVISSGECDRLLRPKQGLRRLSVDELDLELILAVAPPAHMRLETSNNHVDRLVGRLERPIGVPYLRWWR
jgi:hypothetical protein